MRRWAGLAAGSLAAAGLLACAHGPSPAERRQAYFTCPGITADVAAENLERAGLAFEARERGAAVKTGWIEAAVEQAGVTEDLSFYIRADNEGSDVRFSIVLANPSGESVWDEVTAAQVEAEPYRALLNRLRRNVCGSTGEYFPAPK